MGRKRAILAVTGGVAAYKSAELCRLLVNGGFQVKVILTAAATNFIQPLQFKALGALEVRTGFDSDAPYLHIDMARWADFVVVAPATANTIAKISHGIADDLLSTTLLCFKGAILLAPAMNPSMWENPVVQENLAMARKRGVLQVGPCEGRVACGEEGTGKMASVQEIYERIGELSNNKHKVELKVVISAGPTREYIDGVRYISNASSGKMGYELAGEAVGRGMKVKIVSGPVELAPPEGAEIVRVRSAQEMAVAMLKEAEQADVVIQAAAVSDYRPESEGKGKMSSGNRLELELVPTNHILKEILERKKGQFVVAFAGYWKDKDEALRKMRERPGTDLLVANDLSRSDIAMESDENEVALIYPDETTRLLAKSSKEIIAREIWDSILDSLGR